MTEEPLRLRAIKALSRIIEGVTIEAGYKHDLSKTVFRGRSKFGEGDPLPMVSILEPPLEPESGATPATGNLFKGGWDLLVQGFVKDDAKNPTDPAYLLLADVRLALARENARVAASAKTGMDFTLLDLGGRVTAMHIGFGTCRPADEVSDKAYFWMGLRLEIVEDAALPYA